MNNRKNFLITVMAVVRVVSVGWSESDYIANVCVDFYETCTVTIKYWIQKKYPGAYSGCGISVGDVYYSGSFSLSGYKGQRKCYYWKIKTTSIPTGYYYLVVKAYYGGACQDGNWRTIHYTKPSPPPPPKPNAYISSLYYDESKNKIVAIVKYTSGSGTLYIGATIAEGYGGSGCDLYYTGSHWDLPLKAMSASAGDTVRVEWSLPELPKSGTYYVISKIWRTSAPSECIYGKVASFTYHKPAIVKILSITLSKEELEPEETYNITIKYELSEGDYTVYFNDKKVDSFSLSEYKIIERKYIGKAPSEPGTYTYTVKIVRSTGEYDTKSYTITVKKPVPPPPEVPKWIAIPILGGLAGAIYYFAKKRL